MKIKKRIVPKFILKHLPYEKAGALGYVPIPLKGGGTVIGITKTFAKKETVYYIGEDTHTLCIGATRSGKTRTAVLQSIGLQGLSGESMLNCDPKGELCEYTAPYLKRLGYEVITVDFKNPLKSTRYNFLQNVINAVNAGDMPQAVDRAWDITTSLVGEAKGERIWNDGEASIIAAAILVVVIENRYSPEFQNLTNVYHFISEMCRAVGNTLPLNKYMKTLALNHPARGLLGISEVAPSKTRGSFFTAALTTLRLFTNPLIYSMTVTTDFDIEATGKRKLAVFIILPDEKVTYYSLASLFVSQHYETLVNIADRRGGRLINRVNFNLDEFGNFTVIPGFANKLTVGGGRGIRFNLYLQSFAQLDEKYGKDAAKTVKANCQTWIYLQSDDPETLKEMSEKLGNYTVATCSQSSSYSKGSSTVSTSSSTNLTGRALLTPDEVRLISRPYSLITSRENPCLIYAPDLSKCLFNKMFGLGNPEHNRKVREEREQKRPQRDVSAEVRLWGIWNKYNGNYDEYCNNFEAQMNRGGERPKPNIKLKSEAE
jgi:type IV secretion system protein VirD4